MARLKELFVKEIKPNLKQQFGYKNHYMVPQIQKIVLNMGLGIDGNDAKIIKSSQEDLAAITGQKPIVTKFKKSISNFKTRKNTNAGIALPRIKDFRGLSPNGFDKFGNYTFGIKEHIIFPEVNFDKVEKIRGLDITIVIKSIKKSDSFELLKKLNFPFKNKRSN